MGGGLTFTWWVSAVPCEDKALPDKMFCGPHLEQAMARVARAQGDAPKPWSNAVRQSQMGIRRVC